MTAFLNTHDDRMEAVAFPPFLIEHRRRDVKANGTFTPITRLVITPALRAGNLLAELPDCEARSLLGLLTFLTANGHMETTAGQLADLLGISEAKAQARLARLCNIVWHDKPIVTERNHDNGLRGFVPSRHVVGVNAEGGDEEPEVSGTPPPMLSPFAGREALIAHSRANYANPRAEVERAIAEQLGHGAEELHKYKDNPSAQRLLAVGVRHDQVDALLASHTEQEITDQLDWLPMRGAKNPARFLVAAIENRYEPPARVRLERAVAAEEAASADDTSLAGSPFIDSVALDIPDAVSEPNDVLPLPDLKHEDE